MGYIISLLIVIGAILSFTLHVNPLTGLIEKGKAAVTNELIPKTQTEIIINNIKPQRRTLEDFFTSTAPKILTKAAPEEQKEIQEAIEAFQQSEIALVQAQEAEHAENSITGTLIKKALGVLAPLPSPVVLSPSPTTPPPCK
jgi:hypothetical protein